MSLEYDKLLLSDSYRNLREVIQREVNSFTTVRKIGNNWFAPMTLANLARVHPVDYSEFKKKPGEKEALKQLKKEWRKKQRNKFGKEWNKRTSSKLKFHELHIHLF